MSVCGSFGEGRMLTGSPLVVEWRWQWVFCGLKFRPMALLKRSFSPVHVLDDREELYTVYVMWGWHRHH